MAAGSLATAVIFDSALVRTEKERLCRSFLYSFAEANLTKELENQWRFITGMTSYHKPLP
jgi:hypothetical protein